MKKTRQKKVDESIPGALLDYELEKEEIERFRPALEPILNKLTREAYWHGYRDGCEALRARLAGKPIPDGILKRERIEKK